MFESKIHPSSHVGFKNADNMKTYVHFLPKKYLALSDFLGKTHVFF